MEMWKAKVVGYLLVLVALVNAGPTSRIINGGLADLGQFPWLVSLRNVATSAHFCGGSLVTVQHVITAAHCVLSATPTSMFIVTGSISNREGGEAHAVEEIRNHESYVGSSNYWEADISVIKLAAPVTLTATRKPLPLATKDSLEGTSCVMAGWGRVIYPGVGLPAYQQTLNQTALGLAQCRAIWGEIPIADNHLCAYASVGVGICSGDSGSPLVCDGEHAGVASWANLCANGLPDQYARVYYYLDWLRERITDIDV